MLPYRPNSSYKLSGFLSHWRWHRGIGKDQKILDDQNNLRVTPLIMGQELIKQYYTKKYRANICFPQDNSNYIDKISFVSDINKYL